jgi:glycine cleavage system H protein
LRLANGLALYPAHAWARLEGDEATVGADDLVQAALGPVDEVELPAPGTELHQGERLARLHRGRRFVDLLSPVSGRVLSANISLATDPTRVNRSPFGEGWLARVQSDTIARERGALYRGAEARSWFRREVDRLISRLVPMELVASLPDGGRVVPSLHEHIDDIHWTRLTEEFFGGGRV